MFTKLFSLCIRLRPGQLYMKMELTVPLQTLACSNIQITSPYKHEKPMASLSYKDEHITLPCLSLLLPPLSIKSYDADTGKLSLSLAGYPQLLAKLQALQVKMLQAIYTNYTSWFPSEQARGIDETNNSFQPLIMNNCIHLYCPLVTVGSFNEISIFSDSSWSKGTIPSNLLVAGKQVRIGVRLQGISFHQHPITRKLTGRSRVQHRILVIYRC